MAVRESGWKEKYKRKIGTVKSAMKLIKSADTIFIGTGCGQPQHLVNALVECSGHVYDARIVHLLTMGTAPYANKAFREAFRMNSFFVADNVRDALAQGIGDYTPIFLSEIPHEFETGRIPIDVALVSVTPPDVNGFCSLGVSVDIVKSAVANANLVVAQVNNRMPRTLGNSLVHADIIDVFVPYDEDIIEIPTFEPDETLRRIGQNIARLVEDGSTIECGIGHIPQALAEFLRDKKDLGVHTEMFSDWIIDLIECGVITCMRKSLNRGKVVASFCMGSRRLYEYINENPFFAFHPSEYVNDPYIISKHDKMIAINVGLEIDLTGQVCADSMGYCFYSGIGGQVDFVRGAARSKGGKAIIAMPSTAKDGDISRIVSHLTEGAGVVTTRGDVHYVVTEYGVAYLHGKSVRERVLELVSVAHPKFRAELIQAAKMQDYIYKDQIELAWEQIDYPDEMEHHDVLRDGTEILFRPVKPTDESTLSEMLYSLSPKSVRTRFMMHKKAFPHREVQQFTNVDYRYNFAIVGIVPSASHEQIVAIAQYFQDPRSKRAEVALLIQDEWQLKGMGTLLLAHITQIARQHGVKYFYAKVLPDNEPMLSIFRNSGHQLKTTFDGYTYDIIYDLTSPERSEGNHQ